MAKRRWIETRVLLILVASIAFGGTSALGAEKIRIGTPVKGAPLYFLLPLAAEDRGFWKEQGLEAEWLSLRSGRDLDSALATGRAQFGINPTGTVVHRAARGLATVIVADLEGFQPWKLWVRSDSPYKGPKDMKGAKIGVVRLGDITHAYARVIFRAHGLEKEVKYVAAGGILEMLAALKAGSLDGLSLTTFTMVLLEHQGVARNLASLSDYLPQEWDPFTLNATKTLIDKDPETVRKGVNVILAGANYTMDNPRWAVEKIKAETRWPEEVAKKAYGWIRYSRDGKIHPEWIETVRNFFIEYDLVPKDRVPPSSQLYSDRFLPGR